MLVHSEVVQPSPRMKELERFDSCSRYAVNLLSDALEKAEIKESTNVTTISTGESLSDVYRVQLNKSEYSSSVIAKIPNYTYIKNNASRLNQLNKLYTEQQLKEKIEHDSKFASELHNREVLVYRYSTLNFKFNIKMPQFYFGNISQDGDEKQEILLIEDFTNLYKPNENFTLTVGQVEQVIDEICKIQFETVNDPELETAFPLLQSQVESMSRCVLMSANLFSRRHIPWFTKRILRRIQSMALPQNLENILLTNGTDFKTLVHGDLDAKNLLFQNENNLLSIINYQSTHCGSPITDLASLIAINLDPKDRKESELLLVRQFVENWNRMNKDCKKLSLVETELMYKEALKYGMLKLLVILVVNPESDEINDQFPEGLLTARLKALIEDVFGVKSALDD